MVRIIFVFTKYIVTKDWLSTDARLHAIKVAMSLLTDINVGPSRAPLASISPDNLTTMVTDLTNLGYKLNLQWLKIFYYPYTVYAEYFVIHKKLSVKLLQNNIKIY